jgi:hypothetical protein
MYLGAVIALKDGLDPERLCKAAHQMRELMEKISEIVDVEIRALKQRMGQKVAELAAVTQRVAAVALELNETDRKIKLREEIERNEKWWNDVHTREKEQREADGGIPEAA